MANSSAADRNMKWFEFPKLFSGSDFYEKYKNATFLKDENNLRTILLRSDDLEKCYKTLEPGELLSIRGMIITPNVPLVLKKSALVDESDIHQDNFTLRRLLGLVAAYIYSKYSNQGKVFHSIESERLGLTPPKVSNKANDYNRCYGYNQPLPGLQYNAYQAYYAAVPGAELFYDQFDYYPFLFALRRFELKLISEQQLLAIANTRNNDTIKSQVMQCVSDMNASNIASQIGFNLHSVAAKAPQGVQCYFKKQCGYY